ISLDFWPGSLNCLDEFGENFLLLLRDVGARAGDLAAGVERGGCPAGAFEETSEGVVIGGGNGVEFVVVAARAGDRQAEECLAKQVDLVFVSLRFGQPNIDWPMLFFVKMP